MFTKLLQFIPVHNARECVEGMLNIAKVCYVQHTSCELECFNINFVAATVHMYMYMCQELIEPTKWAEHVTTINGMIQTWHRVKNRSYLLW